MCSDFDFRSDTFYPLPEAVERHAAGLTVDEGAEFHHKFATDTWYTPKKRGDSEL